MSGNAPSRGHRSASGLSRSERRGAGAAGGPAPALREQRRRCGGLLLPAPAHLRAHPSAAARSGGEGAPARQAARVPAEPRPAGAGRGLRRGSRADRRATRAHRPGAALVPGCVRAAFLLDRTARVRGGRGRRAPRVAHHRGAAEDPDVRRAARHGCLHRAARAGSRVHGGRAREGGAPTRA